MSTHLYTYINPTRERDLDDIIRVLSDDGVIALPMDLSWAFCCDASLPKALARLHLLKPSHPKERPYSLVCNSIAMASHLANIDNAAYRFVKKIVPGPFTVLLERHATLPKQIKDKRRVVGIRIPDAEIVLELIKRYGKPLASTTIPPMRAEDEFSPLPGFGWEVEEKWGHALDMVVDIGSEALRQETTIVDLTTGQPEIVRLGAGDPALLGL